MNTPSFGLRAAITVKARTLSGLLMTDGLFLELLRCDTVGDIARRLSETEGYREIFRDTHPEELHRTDLEARLSLVPFIRMLPFLHYVEPVRKRILLSWKARFDADVIKRVLRYVQAGGGSREILRRMVTHVPLTSGDGDRLLAAGSTDEALAALSGSPFHEVLKEPLRRMHTSGGTLFSAEMAVDTFVLDALAASFAPLGGEEKRQVLRLFGAKADLLNIYWIYRARRFFGLPPEEIIGRLLRLRYRTPFRFLSALARAESPEAFRSLINSSHYAAVFSGIPTKRSAADETAMEASMHRLIRRTAANVRNCGAPGIHVVLAWLTLLEIEIRDIVTIIEDVRYRLDRSSAHRFLSRELEAGEATA